jgi:hypothetical protein
VTVAGDVIHNQGGSMKNTFTQLWKLCLITVAGLLGSMTVGLMMHGSEVFDYMGINFVYVSFGLSGAFIFAFYHIRGLSNSITAAVSISTIQFIIATTWMPTLNSIIWSYGVNLPVVWLAFLFERKLAAFHWGKFFIIGLVYGTMFVLLTLIVGALQKISYMPPVVFRDNFIDGLSIGLGMGLGVQAGEAFIHSLYGTFHTSVKK